MSLQWFWINPAGRVVSLTQGQLRGKESSRAAAEDWSRVYGDPSLYDEEEPAVVEFEEASVEEPRRRGRRIHVEDRTEEEDAEAEDSPGFAGESLLDD